MSDWRRLKDDEGRRAMENYERRIWENHVQPIWTDIQRHIRNTNQQYRWSQLVLSVDPNYREDIIDLILKKYHYIVVPGAQEDEIVLYSRKSPRPYHGGSL